jgi:hypothetical protein
MIPGSAGRCRIDAIEPEVAEFQCIDEHIDRAYRIALVHPIIKAFRQQRRLLAIRPLNETLHHPTPIQQGNHSIGGVFTQPGPAKDVSMAALTTACPAVSVGNLHRSNVPVAPFRHVKLMQDAVRAGVTIGDIRRALAF